VWTFVGLLPSLRRDLANSTVPEKGWIACQRLDLLQTGETQPPSSLKPIDRALLATERQAFSKVAWHWPELEGAEPLDLEIEAWLPPRAGDEFRARFATLDRQRRVSASQ
jgi:hypothetical protein